MDGTIKCKCGKSVFSETLKLSVGAYIPYVVEQETGFHYINTHDGDNIMLCDECFIKASKLVKELIDITGSEYIYLGGFLK